MQSNILFLLSQASAICNTSPNVNHYNAAYKELGKVDKDITRITGGSPGLEVNLLDKPNVSE